MAILLKETREREPMSCFDALVIVYDPRKNIDYIYFEPAVLSREQAISFIKTRHMALYFDPAGNHHLRYSVHVVKPDAPRQLIAIRSHTVTGPLWCTQTEEEYD